MNVAQRLLQRLDDLADLLAERGDALALLALGSVGLATERLDDHSDLDFFVVVEDSAKPRYLETIDWLERLSPVAFSFANSVDGRKVLFSDSLYAEYAVFTVDEIRGASFPAARLVWRRADAPPGLEQGAVPAASPYETPEYHVNEALTNLYVGLHRDARGEQLAAMRLIQVYAVDRLLGLLDLTGRADAERQDAFVVERGAERRFAPKLLPLATMTPGYAHNRNAALAILDWLKGHVDVNPALAAAIRALALVP